MFVMSESENLQCSYNIQYTVFGMMYIFLGLLWERIVLGDKSFPRETNFVAIQRRPRKIVAQVFHFVQGS